MARDPEPGTECGAYVLRREIGRGGMAVVFEAEHKDLGKRVAIKLLQSPAAGNPILRARFQREGRAAVRVEHPHVAQIFDVGQVGDAPFLVLELVDGPTLAELIRREAPMSPARVIELAMPIVSAVAKAHALGVIHRDLKPANILVARDHHGKPSPKVLDFGLSKILDPDEEQLTREQGTMGSLAYMAPEQLRSAADVDPACDQWAFAVVLYECLTGLRPFRGDSAPAIMRAILEASPAPPSSLREDIPKPLDAVVLRALRHDPSERFPSMNAFGVALLRFANTATYGLWAREFEEVANVDVTADDVPSAGPIAPNESRAHESVASMASVALRAEPRRKARASWPWSLVLMAALVTIVWWARRGTDAQPTTQSVSPPASSVIPATPPPPAPSPVASPSVTTAPSPSTSAPVPPPRPTTIAPVSALLPVKAAASPTQSPSVAAPPPPVRPPPATSTTGMLGSPILE